MERTLPFPRNTSLAAAGGCIGFGVRKTARALGQLYDAALAPLGLKGTQFSLLNAVYLLQGPGMHQLAQALVMDRTTLTRNLRPLEQQGLLQIKPGSDRRERHVHLTAAGEERLALALSEWEKVQGRLTTALGETRAQRLLGDLEELVQLVREN